MGDGASVLFLGAGVVLYATAAARIFIINERRLAYDIRNGVSWLASHKYQKVAIGKPS